MNQIVRLKETIKQKPGSVEARLGLSNLLFDDGKIKEAFTHYLAACKRVKNSKDYLGLGRLAFKFGKSDEAEAHYKKALQLKPDDIQVQASLAQLYLYRGWLSETITMYEKILEKDPENRMASECKNEVVRALNSCNINLQEIDKTKIRGKGLFYPDIAYETLVNRVLNNYPRIYQPVKHRYVVNLYQLRLGGIQKKVTGLVRKLHTRKKDVESIVLLCQSLTHREEDSFLLPVLKNDGIRVEEYYPQNDTDFSFDQPYISEYAETLKAMGEHGRKIACLMLALIANKPEIVHGFGYQCVEFGIAAVLAGVPRIVLHSGNMRPHTMTTSDYWADHIRWVTHAYKALAKLDNLFITNNSKHGAWDFTQWLELPPGKIQVLYNGVDFESSGKPDHDKIQELRNSLKIPEDHYIVGSAFRFTEQKRPFLWLQVAERLAKFRKDIHFIILGDGPLFENFKSEIRTSDIRDRIHLPGQVLDMQNWYRLMDVVLLTSIMEGTSNVAIEAQWHGVPVVSPNVGGMSETILHGQSGWLVYPDKPELLAKQVIRVLNNSTWCENAARIGHDFVNHQFNIDKMVQGILDFNNKPV